MPTAGRTAVSRGCEPKSRQPCAPPRAASQPL